MQNDTREVLRSLVMPLVTQAGYELVDVELAQEGGRKIVRLFVDKPGGISLGECATISHAVEDVLEVEAVISGAYHLEVSSPGLNRPLRTKEHFEAVIGQTVTVSTEEKIDGRRRYRGVLKQVEGDTLVITIDNQDFKVPLNKLSKANLDYHFKTALTPSS
ncbi:MAG: hypothetical protein ACD_62C00170G0007 [uncultured bacterium]|nr:MAG: hypothetical protein ACD_62C00170G0007 [uncultured bacterium]HLD44620.1 ribosome maturation factor RimP [bacterium]